jgi:alpha-D-xyloside xylohydrolase
VRRQLNRFVMAVPSTPITQAGTTSRTVYLPHAGRWYDFWTGYIVKEGTHAADAPLDRIPLHVRAGSIIPLGPEVEYAEQKPNDPIELQIYAGADGDFNLYEDAGDSYDYEKGEHSIIPVHWDEKNGHSYDRNQGGQLSGYALATNLFDGAG